MLYIIVSIKQGETMNTKMVYNRTTKDFDIKPIDFKMGTDGKVVWYCGNITSNYSFENPKKGRHLTKNFLMYINLNSLLGKTSTKRGFYKYINKPLSKGNCCTFFRSIVESGIVSKHSEWNGNFTETTYSIGCNYHHYLEGNLRRYRYWKDGEWDMMIELPKTLLRNL